MTMLEALNEINPFEFVLLIAASVNIGICLHDLINDFSLKKIITKFKKKD